jgi:hypothetical protein
MSEKRACMRVVGDEVWYDPSYMRGDDDYSFMYKLKNFLVGPGSTNREGRVSLEEAFGRAVPGDQDYTMTFRHEINALPVHIAGKRFNFTDNEHEIKKFVEFDTLPEAVKQEIRESHNLDGVKVVSEGQFLCSAVTAFKKEDPNFKCGYNSVEIAEKVYERIQPKFYYEIEFYEIEFKNEVNSHWADKIANQNVIIVD